MAKKPYQGQRGDILVSLTLVIQTQHSHTPRLNKIQLGFAVMLSSLYELFWFGHEEPEAVKC